ncbi:MAG: hypothetical protein GF329_22170 [Candidatus Lokiarchaeota archaeon]|nr:hypothetical protein [Candidatus Lokiarchaeota archaeon]
MEDARKHPYRDTPLKVEIERYISDTERRINELRPFVNQVDGHLKELETKCFGQKSEIAVASRKDEEPK